MGQGFFGYNPPDFILNAAKDALDRVECNQYSPTKGRPRLKKAIADAYSPFWGRRIDPETEVTITTGANEGMLSAFMAFIEPGDEVIIFEPFFDQYISNIEMPGGKIVYVPMHPPESGATKTSSAADWTIDFAELEKAITPRTKMIVLNTPHNPVGKVYSRDELQKIGDLCVKNEIIILSDEVYDRLYYVPFTRMATLSPEIEKLTITVGSAGKNFYATGWRVGTFHPPLLSRFSFLSTRVSSATYTHTPLITDFCFFYSSHRLAHGPRQPHQIRLGGPHAHLLLVRLAAPGGLRRGLRTGRVGGLLGQNHYRHEV
ncbi:arylformamidase, variant 2 [Metarhizium acridum]|uniref:arylformamidase, variant 2 n=1 Tax=Metarhizium acridum TaxID=92637 RepID=UPI001C6BF1A9|nr:arylformamidase, variant 2 [Metarhizium acridum]